MKKTFNFLNEDEVKSAILAGANTGFVSGDAPSDQAVSPRIIYNDKTQFRTMCMALQDELKECQEFWFTVAFITNQGLKTIEQSLKAVLAKGGKNRILTSRMNYFNDPTVFRKLLSYPNLEVRVYGDIASAKPEALHAKGYYFSYPKHANVIIGSANLTGPGLQMNQEWNVKLSSLQCGQLLQETKADFERLWRDSQPLTPSWIDTYETQFKAQQTWKQQEKVVSINQGYFVPNAMQQEALASLREQCEAGADKSLLISATGTGKTILSAFAVQEFAPKRMLFLAHREQLLSQAKRSYEQVLRKSPSLFGLLTGSAKDRECDYVFATVQTLQKDETLHSFPPDYFDYIVIDEAHHLGAPTYQKILSYFKPAFMLGMTATPDRTDNFNLYEYFDYNIGYEIRLQQAQAYNLLCPFHYYAVADIVTEDGVVGAQEFQHLVSEERIRYILEKADEYGDANQPWYAIKGLVFCSSREEARAMATAFTDHGRPAVALTGEDSPARRAQAVADLECGKLQYICTVDIFNEGIDIPAVNLVLMLRPTDSSIVFIQQLGRGLRKHQSKEYVVIIDFIGNNDKNYLIASALSGDATGNREKLRKFIGTGHRCIEGQCTIHFEEVAKSKIYAALNRVNFSENKKLKEAYQALRNKLGRIPAVADFAKHGSFDIVNYFTKYETYYRFLCKNEPMYTEHMSVLAEDMLAFLCRYFSRGKRPQELELLRDLFESPDTTRTWPALLANNITQVMTGKFHEVNSNNPPKTACWVEAEILETVPGVSARDAVQTVCYRRSPALEAVLQEPAFVDHATQVIAYGLRQYALHFTNTYEGTDFVWQELYNIEEVERFLCWNKALNGGAVGGYKYDEYSHTLPVFINYDDIQDDTQDKMYDDHFVDTNMIIAYTKNNRTKDSKDVLRITKGMINPTAPDASQYKDIRIYLFVTKQGKRMNADGETMRSDFKEVGGKVYYFLGEIEAAPEDILETYNHKSTEENQPKVCRISYHLKTPVSEDLYEYITREMVLGEEA